MTSICKAGMACLISYHLIDSGLARLLALETLTHGTGPANYIDINIFGVDPSRCRSQVNSIEHFHVFKDSRFGLNPDNSLSMNRLELIMLKELSPKIQALHSAGICGIFTPTLKFRFTPDELVEAESLGHFVNNPDYTFFRGYKITQPIKPSRIGITGSLINGINRGMFKRMTNNPKKVLLGASLLAAGIFNLKMQFEKIETHPKK